MDKMVHQNVLSEMQDQLDKATSRCGSLLQQLDIVRSLTQAKVTPEKEEVPIGDGPDKVYQEQAQIKEVLSRRCSPERETGDEEKKAARPRQKNMIQNLLEQMSKIEGGLKARYNLDDPFDQGDTVATEISQVQEMKEEELRKRGPSACMDYSCLTSSDESSCRSTVENFEPCAYKCKTEVSSDSYDESDSEIETGYMRNNGKLLVGYQGNKKAIVNIREDPEEFETRNVCHRIMRNENPADILKKMMAELTQEKVEQNVSVESCEKTLAQENEINRQLTKGIRMQNNNNKDRFPNEIDMECQTKKQQKTFKRKPKKNSTEKFKSLSMKGNKTVAGTLPKSKKRSHQTSKKARSMVAKKTKVSKSGVAVNGEASEVEGATCKAKEFMELGEIREEKVIAPTVAKTLITGAVRVQTAIKGEADCSKKEVMGKTKSTFSLRSYEPEENVHYTLSSLSTRLKTIDKLGNVKISFNTIPFVVGRSITRSHHLGLNIQHTLSLYKRCHAPPMLDPLISKASHFSDLTSTGTLFSKGGLNSSYSCPAILTNPGDIERNFDEPWTVPQKDGHYSHSVNGKCNCLPRRGVNYTHVLNQLLGNEILFAMSRPPADSQFTISDELGGKANTMENGDMIIDENDSYNSKLSVRSRSNLARLLRQIQGIQDKLL